MKRCFWISVVCGLAVAGCSKNESSTPPAAPAPAAQPAKPAGASEAQAAPTQASKEVLSAGLREAVAVSNGSVANPVVVNANETNTAAVRAAAQGSDSVLTSGLRQAVATNAALPGVTNEVQQILIPAIQSAVADLGTNGGFLNNTNVKIGMPDSLQNVESVLRGLGQNKLPDQVITGVNRAAETVAPVAGSALTNAAGQLNPADVKAAMTNAPGTNSMTALTDLLRQKSEPQLTQKIQPMVKSALDKTGAGAICQQLASSGNLNPFGGAASSASTNAAGVDSFLTSKTLDGFFKVVGNKEAQIRQGFAAKAGVK